MYGCSYDEHDMREKENEINRLKQEKAALETELAAYRKRSAVGATESDTGESFVDGMAAGLREFFAAKEEYLSAQSVSGARFGEAVAALKELLVRYDNGER